MNGNNKKFSSYYLIALALLAVILVAVHGDDTPAVPLDAEPSYQAIADRLQRLYEGIGPHPIGHAENTRLRTRLLAELEAMGAHAEVQTQYVCTDRPICGEVNNVIAWWKAPENGNGVLLSAHYDSANVSRGVSDNGVNVAISLEVLAAYKDREIRNPLVVLFSDAEEVGSLGAQAFAEYHRFSGDIGAVVNIEARGTSGPSLMFETNAGNNELARLYASKVSLPKSNSMLPQIYEFMNNSTDFNVFKKHDVPGYNIAFIGGEEHYHTLEDSLDNIREASLRHQSVTTMQLVDALSNHPELKTLRAEHNRVYTDVAGSFVVGISAPVAEMLAFALLAVLVTYIIVQRRTIAPVRTLGMPIVLLVAIAIGATVVYGLMLLVASLQTSAPPWPNRPVTGHMLIWFSGILAPAALTDLLTRRTNVSTLTVGILLYFIALSVLTTLFAPGFAFLFLFPCIPAVAVLLYPSAWKSEPPQHLFVVALLILLVGYGWSALENAMRIESALGIGYAGYLLPVFFTPVAALLVFLSRVSRLERRVHILGYAATAFTSAVLVIYAVLPIVDPVKAHANVVKLDYTPEAQTFWLLTQPSHRVHPALGQTSEFDTAELPSILDRFDASALLEKTPNEGAPTGFTVERQHDDNVIHFKLTVEPDQSHRWLRIHVPALKSGESISVSRDGELLFERQTDDGLDSSRRIIVFPDKDTADTYSIVINGTADGDILVEDVRLGVTNTDQRKWWPGYVENYREQHRGARSIAVYRIAFDASVLTSITDNASIKLSGVEQ